MDERGGIERLLERSGRGEEGLEGRGERLEGPPPTPPAPPALSSPPSSSQVQAKVSAIKEDANSYFTRRDYLKAAEAYAEAIKLTPATAAERVDLHCSRAACYYQLKR